MSKFRLSKHYLDCVAPDGHAVIVYAAALQWHGLTLCYSSILSAPPDEPVSATTSLESFTAPHADSTGAILFHHGDFRGRWSASGDPIVRTLYSIPAGKIIWTCLAPHPSVRLQLADRTITGTGYAEHLSLTLPPWELPIHTLRWGRYLSAEDSLIWIQWRGPHPLDLLLHNGNSILAAPSIDNRGLTAPNLTLEMPGPRTLRDGSLLTTAFANVPLLAKLFPHSILRTHETKWLSPATLCTPSHSSTGHAIHELVTFPRSSENRH